MEAIAEDESDVPHSSPKPVLTKAKPIAGRVQTPGSRLMSSTSLSTPESCKYEQMHSLRQRLLSEKLQSASSPDSKLTVLSQSPMIEFKRRKR